MGGSVPSVPTFIQQNKKPIFMGFADKCQQKIQNRHLFEDSNPTSDEVGA